MNELRKIVSRKEIPENENPNKAIGIVYKILNFNNEQIGEGRPSDLATRLKKLLLNKCFVKIANST